MTAVLFNLFLNTATSFAAGLGVVLLSLKFFKVPQGRWSLFFLSLPFVKVLWDLGQGLPTRSLLNAGINPFLMPEKHGILGITAGLSKFGPQVQLNFWTLGLDEKQYATSLPDYLYYGLQKFYPSIPTLLLGLMASLSLFLVARRLFMTLDFERSRRLDRKIAQLLFQKSLGKRQVDVYVSDFYHGSAFTGGLCAPYICFPRSLFLKLSPDEFEAVLLHELAHVKHYDLVFSFATQILGDLLWFIPGYRFLQKKIENLRETLADREALLWGAKATSLASVLLLLAEEKWKSQPLAIYSAFIKKKSLIARRVENLISPEVAGKSGLIWNFTWLRPFIAFWIVGAVSMATFAGNSVPSAKIYSPSEALNVLQNWLATE